MQMSLSNFSFATAFLLYNFPGVYSVPPSTYYPSGAICTEYNISVHPASVVNTFNEALKWTDNYGLTNFISYRSGRDPTAPPTFVGERNLTAHFTIHGTFCTPKDEGTGRATTVLLASHGLGFDESYWNIPYHPETYNFAEYIIEQGYSIFYYDRLGVGKSSRISGYVNQLSLQLDVLQQLIGFINEGKCTGKIGVPSSTVLVGHSFGSILSHGIAKVAPHTVDAIILTGYLPVATYLNVEIIAASWQPRIANLEGQGRWHDYDTGYVTWVDLFSNVDTFFKSPGYAQDAAVYAEANKQPFGIAEAFSGSPALFPNTTFTKPVLIVTGAEDFLFCEGYCADVIQPAAQDIFPLSKQLLTYLQPDTGHGMNFHKNAKAYFKVVTDFLASSEL